ncbi:MAG TPA: type II secretion system minor pseudopilin GspK [Gammaproteobacteria bacterium]|nr:type II secretion system minor pseudopilin GspK [Gammaproteobacteria bacterium]
MTSRRSQRGIAAIVAILIVAIGTMIAVNLVWQGTLDQRRAAAALAADQGLLYVQGAEAWAADILRQDLVDSPDADHLGEEWAIELPPLPVDGGAIQGRLEDLQGRFNLNNLIARDGTENQLARKEFERLLALVEIDPSLAGAVVDWLDADTDLRFPTGGEDVSYSSSDPPYRTANSVITSVSELLAISGMDRESYARLAPYLAALPQGTKLNVNTASEVVLASLSENIDIGTAASLVEQRGDAEFLDIDSTFAGLVEPDVLQTIDGVSEHFLLTATVTLGTNQLTMRSVLQRDRSGITRALFRSLGVE